MDKNSVWKALAFMRMVYNYAVEEVIIISENNSFKAFKVGGYTENASKIKFPEIEQVNALNKILIERSVEMQDMTFNRGL